MRALLAALLLPPAGPMLLLLLVAFFFPAGLWRRTSLLLAAALLWLSACEGVMGPLAQAWAPAHAQPRLASNGQDGRTLVLVLGGGVRFGSGPDGGYEPKTETLERLHRGAWWARQFQLPLAFSGGRSPNPDPDQPSEAEVAQRVLREHYGLQLAWSEGRSANTAENARFSAEMLRHRSTQQVILVTHALHMPRALRHFRAAAPEVVFLPAPLSRQPATTWRLTDYLPSAEGVRLGRYLAYEWLAERLGR